MEFHDIVGTLGVACIVAMYALLQLGRIAAAQPLFSILNAVGALLILISLSYEFNWSAALIESIWLAVSLFGLWKALKGSRAQS
jgi:hypothetical protein